MSTLWTRHRVETASRRPLGNSALKGACDFAFFAAREPVAYQIIEQGAKIQFIIDKRKEIRVGRGSAGWRGARATSRPGLRK